MDQVPGSNLEYFIVWGRPITGDYHLGLSLDLISNQAQGKLYNQVYIYIYI